MIALFSYRILYLHGYYHDDDDDDDDDDDVDDYVIYKSIINET
jgi:hypothetical protein